jgi:hypothetical protein
MPGFRVHLGAAALLLAVIAWGAVAPAAACAQDAPPGAVIVLRNGNVLVGRVTRQGDHYRLAQAGASLQIPANQVEVACASLTEAYEWRRRERGGTSADSHLELARWCISQDMLDHAAREILDARTIDPGHPDLGRIELRLRQQLANRQPSAPRPPAAASHVPQSVALPFVASKLTPSLEAQARFVRSIQPMLVQGCAVGGCHQPGSRQRLQLDRWALEGQGDPELIRQNLAAVLAHVAPDDPPSSPLLRWARQRHGDAAAAQSAPITAYQAALLLEWLNEVAGVTPPALAPTGDAMAPVEPAGAPGEPAATDPQSRNHAAAAEPAALYPRDQFDPEIFNRQSEAKRAEAAEAEVDVPLADVQFDDEPDSAETGALEAGDGS